MKGASSSLMSSYRAGDARSLLPGRSPRCRGPFLVSTPRLSRGPEFARSSQVDSCLGKGGEVQRRSSEACLNMGTKLEPFKGLGHDLDSGSTAGPTNGPASTRSAAISRSPISTSIGSASRGVVTVLAARLRVKGHSGARIARRMAARNPRLKTCRFIRSRAPRRERRPPKFDSSKSL